MIRKSRIKKYICCFLAANLLFQVITPTAAMALTGGPSQPEMESFEPVSTTEMVDLFTGDFVYNIPLLTVPGPNGGYPINIAYHAGIGMEQEASWVGLGWNISPGVINRQLRGIPDDFNGDEKITKTLHYKPNWNFSLGFSVSQQNYYEEVFGADPKDFLGSVMHIHIPQNYQLYFNSYKGVGFSFSSDFSKRNVHSWGQRGKFSIVPALSYSFDTQGGFGVQPSLSVDFNITKNGVMHHYGGNINAGFNSRQGLSGFGYIPNKLKSYDGARVAAVNFSSSAYMPPLTTNLGGITAKMTFETKTVTSGGIPSLSSFFGGLPTFANYGNFNGKTYNIGYSQQYIKDKTLEYPAYGYLNLGQADISTKENRLMDYNREKDHPLTKDVPSLPVPVNTYDVFMVKGQGTGGAFRAFRNDIGLFTEPSLMNDFGNGAPVFEFAQDATNNHFGFDLTLGYSQSYSGPWKTQAGEMDDFHFKSSEPVYFKMAGEMTANEDADGELSRLRNEDAVKPGLNMQFEGRSFVPKVLNSDGSGNALLDYNIRNNSERRSTGIMYRTREQIEKNGSGVKNCEYIWNRTNTTDPWTDWQTSGADWEPIGYTISTDRKAHQIAEISVVNPDGNRYNYALPAYNTRQEDYHFACDEATASGWVSSYKKGKRTNYSGTDVTTGNVDGYDHYFSKTEFPDYAHSYLLTSIISPDYVDLTRNGPTSDDLGYYVKFNYYDKDENFKWRAPYSGAFLHKNGLSDFNDDKASYTYGEKEMWYMHSIETKTHVAVFELGEREDGVEAESVDLDINAATPGSGNKKVRYLKSIKLYAKSDLATPIKTVNFKYSYDLCGDVENNTGATVSNNNIINNTGKGKLTLKKIWFTYLNNTKGELSPYEFDYHETVAAENPDYSISQVDRWGNYKPDAGTSGTGANDENPYVDQTSKANADAYMGVWNLKSIKLPSGSQIDITYESDDYAYVQNKIATQMFRIIGTSETNTTNINGNGPIDGDNTRIYFNREGSGSIDKYLEGLSHVYFKALVDLKKKPDSNDRAYEYVSGYAPIVGSNTVSASVAYIDVAKVKATKTGLLEVNPIRKAAWDYLKNDKPNYLPGNNTITNNPSSISWQTFNSLIGIFTNALSMITGYYRHCQIMDYAQSLYLSDTDYPSFIRLNSPDKCKFGGGHRVKKITIDDGWDDITSSAEEGFSYGMEYSYTLADGSSSGVAEYEPMVGGEENALRKPSSNYSSNNNMFTLANGELYLEEPYGESYFPAASVGYSRVIVKSLTRSSELPPGETYTKSRPGFSVYEFFTAKDFPVLVEKTTVTAKKYTPDISIPFIGSLGFENRGYTQGYKITLNDMHGKMKATSTYAAFDNPDVSTAVPVTKTEYRYNTINPYSSNNINRLSPMVTVLDADAVTRTAAMGQTYDFFAEMIQHSSWGTEAGGGINFDYNPPSLLVPSFWLNVNYNEAITRMAVTNKIIYRSGILMEVRTTKDGGTSIAQNLIFDKKTGIPLLTSVTNNFDAPVYTYNFAAHWSYPGMADAMDRYGKTVAPGTGATSGNFTLTSAEAACFRAGDMVQVLFNSGTEPYQDFWVESVTGNVIHLIDEFGVDIGTTPVLTIKVMQPVQRNLLGVNSGTIVSLGNPVTGRVNDAITALNNKLDLHTDDGNPTTSFNMATPGCSGSGERTVQFSISTTGSVTTIAISQSGSSCTGTSIVVNNAPSADFDDYIHYDILKKGNYIYFEDEAGGPLLNGFTGTWNDPNNCFPDCLDGVLHASSATFNDEWAYNYIDAGSPVTTISSTATATLASSVTAENPYRYGTKGIWRSQSSFAYQVDRKQSAPKTDISKDGTYNNFVLFNWLANDVKDDNDKWTFVNEVTRYSPYGYELENKDALDIYKSALYGYNNSVVTGIAANSSYHEIAFDGFEDYSSTSLPSGSDHGHLLLTPSSGTLTLTNTRAHTGSYAVSVPDSGTITHTGSTILNSGNINSKTVQGFNISTINKSGDKYTVSAWFYRVSGSGTPAISALVDGAAPASASTTLSPVIDGWQKADYTFEFSGTPTTDVEITFGMGASPCYIDDIRIQPFKSGMTTYVYDPVTLWLVAELDNRNFATFYNYDEEGTLVQVKKETEKGVATIKTTRSNIKR